jgi:hypothetical protein
MPDLLHRLSGRAFWRAWVCALVAFAASALVQLHYGSKLINTRAPRGIVSLELAGTQSATKEILLSWSDSAQADALLGLCWDFLFLAIYGLVLAHACAWSGRTLDRVLTNHPRSWSRIGLVFAWMAWIAAFCDASEDICLLLEFRIGPGPVLARLACGFAGAKFMLLLLCLLFVLHGALIDWPKRAPATTPLMRLRDLELFLLPMLVLAAFVNVEGGIVLGIFVLMVGYYSRHGFLRHLLRYLADHPSQALILCLLYLLVYGLIGKGLGIANLLWPDFWLARILSSLGATMLLGLLGVSAYYLMPESGQHGESGQREIVTELSSFLETYSWHWPSGWLEPKGLEASEISKLLRVARLPFLLMLLLPALLPGAFPYVTPVAPIYSGKARIAWLAGLHSDVRFGSAAWLFALTLWLTGILLGVVVFKLMNWVSPSLSASRKSVWIGLVLCVCFGALDLLVVPVHLRPCLLPFGIPVGWMLVKAQDMSGRPRNERGQTQTRAGIQNGDAERAQVPGEPETAAGIRNGDAESHLRKAYRKATAAPHWATISPVKWRSFYRFCYTIIIVYIFMATTLYSVVAVPPALAIYMAIGLVSIGVLAFTLRFTRRWRFIAAAILLLGFGMLNGDHQFRYAGMDYRTKESAPGKDAPDLGQKIKHYIENFRVNQTPPANSLLADRDVLCQWERFMLGLSEPRADCSSTVPPQTPQQQKPKLAVVCVTGGASRSAYWSARMLDRIERRIGGFHKNVRLITGASGGMLGTSYYVRWLLDGGPDHPDWMARHPDWVEEIPVNSLEEVARHVALRSQFYALGNWAREQPYDRGTVLERTWGRLNGTTFKALRDGEAVGELPSLVFSPMTIEDGRRLLISNLDLRCRSESPWDQTQDRVLALNQGNLIDWRPESPSERLYSLSAIEYGKFFPNPEQLRLSTAVRMSASFPWISPAVALPGTPSLRVVDAGYYDSYGVSVAVSWIFQNQPWLCKHTSGVVLVQIRDCLSFDSRFSYSASDSSSGLLAWLWSRLESVHSPIDGAIQARETVSMFRNDQEVSLLGSLFEQTMEPGFFSTVIFENAADATPRDSDHTSWPGDELVRYLETGHAAPDSGPGLTKDVGPDLSEQIRSAEDVKALAESGVEVAMNWYLTASELRALDQSMPRVDDNKALASNKSRRQKRLEQLAALVNRGDMPRTGDGPALRWKDDYERLRPLALREYARARNFERLEALARWMQETRGRRKDK